MSATATIGTLLRNYRKARGYSQKQLAGNRYASNYVSQIERDKVVPSPEALAFFARRLRVSLLDFLEAYMQTEPSLKQRMQFAVRLAQVGSNQHARELMEEVKPELSNINDEAHYLYYLALIESTDGNNDDAVRLLHQAEDMSAQDRDLLLNAKVQIKLGLIAKEEYDYRAAEEHFRFGVSLYHIHKIRNRSLHKSLVGNLANVLSKQEKYREAMDYYDMLQTMAKEDRDIESHANALWGMGLCLMFLEHHNEALESFNQALFLYDTLGSNMMKAGLYNNRGILHAKLGNREAALADVQRSLEIKEEKDTPDSLVITLNELYKLYQEVNDEKQVEECVKRIESLFHQCKDINVVVEACNLLVPYYLERGLAKQAADALAVLEERLSEVRQQSRFTLQCRLLLAKYYALLNDCQSVHRLIACTD